MSKVDDCWPCKGSNVRVHSCAPLPDGVYENARVVVEGGCIVDVKEGEPFVLKATPCCSTSGDGGDAGGAVSTVNSTTVSLTGDGDVTPLSASVKVSTATDNTLQIQPSGLYVPPAVDSDTVQVNPNGQTVQLSGDGSAAFPLNASVKLDTSSDNVLEVTSTGLKAPPTPMQFSSQAGNTITNGVDGKPGAFIEIEKDYESISAAYLTGLGTILAKLGVDIHLSGDAFNALETRQAAIDSSDPASQVIKTLYAKAETSPLSIVGGIGLNNADLVGGAICNIENGRVLWVAPMRLALSASSTPPAHPLVQAVGPSVQIPVDISVYGGSGLSAAGHVNVGSIDVNGTVINFTSGHGSTPLPSGYTWTYGVAVPSDSGTHFIPTRSYVTATDLHVGGYFVDSAPPRTVKFLVVLIGYDPTIGEFGP